MMAITTSNSTNVNAGLKECAPQARLGESFKIICQANRQN
jgi:hypothetical protein